MVVSSGVQAFGMRPALKSRSNRGGGGMGFYQLNLSGTPAPFPTVTPTPSIPTGRVNYVVKAGDTLSRIAASFGVSVDELAQANNINDPSTIYIGQTLIIPGQPLPATGQTFESLRGIVHIAIYKKTDGSQRIEYNFATKDNQFPYVLLEGDVQNLQNNNGRPADIWGTLDHFDQNGTPVVKVDRFEIPFPDLKFQILRGTQKNAEVQGQPVIVFTTDDGISYVQIGPDGTPDILLTVGVVGSPILLEALAIPDEKFGDYPAIRVFSASMAINPKNGQPMEMQITADQLQVVDEAQNQLPPPGENASPSLTIEKVELVYFVSNPLYQANDLNASRRSPYIQPGWHFSGHYSNGNEFDILIQALKQEFLSPEIAPHIR